MATDLAVRNDTPISDMDDTIRVGKILAQSGFFADAKEAAQAITKVLAGAELGFGPVASMTGIYLVKGHVTLSANLIGAAIKRSGKYNFRVTTLTDAECIIAFFEGGESIGVSSFTMAQAKAAGIAGDTYSKFPRNMLYARAMSNGAKWFTPDVFAGPVYTPDELGAQVDGETGEILHEPTVVPRPVKRLEAVPVAVPPPDEELPAAPRAPAESELRAAESPVSPPRAPGKGSSQREWLAYLTVQARQLGILELPTAQDSDTDEQVADLNRWLAAAIKRTHAGQ